MRNERLRALLLERGQTPDKLAEAVQVDAKTVERWITKGRIRTAGTGSPTMTQFAKWCDLRCQD